MKPEPIDEVSLSARILEFLGRGLRHLLFRAKRIFGLLAQSLQRDELRELSIDARALGSAASESISHVGAELREMNERLSTLERDVERLGKLLEQWYGEAAQPADEGGRASAQPLSTD